VARAAVRRRLTPLPWRTARLVDARAETPTARTLVLDVEDWPGHLAGQHVDIRLTAADGYVARRTYSIASAPDVGHLELTVQLVPGGEVSAFLVEDYRIGDPLEVRGPLGGWFVWGPMLDGPVLLVGGGSGVVPLMAMLRHRRDSGNGSPFRLVYSVRRPDDAYYRAELEAKSGDGIEVTIVYTRKAPDGWRRPPHRLTKADLPPPDDSPRVYVCGPTPFVESVATLLIDLGHDPVQIRTERFGPTGE